MIKKFLFSLKRQILKKAYQRADKIIYEAELEAQKRTRESEILKHIQIEAEKIKQETITTCRKIKAESANL